LLPRRTALSRLNKETMRRSPGPKLLPAGAHAASGAQLPVLQWVSGIRGTAASIWTSFRRKQPLVKTGALPMCVRLDQQELLCFPQREQAGLYVVADTYQGKPIPVATRAGKSGVDSLTDNRGRRVSGGLYPRGQCEALGLGSEKGSCRDLCAHPAAAADRPSVHHFHGGLSLWFFVCVSSLW